MMKPVQRIGEGSNANPVDGRVVYDKGKLLWNVPIILISLVFAPFTFSLSALLVCLLLTYTFLLIGHSVGMHRMMIHRSFVATNTMEKLLIYIGVLVGMSGPFGIIAIHDLRDWAQRQNNCHPFFSHKENYFKDLFWQLCCTFRFKNPPNIHIENKLKEDKFYVFLEKTWRFHQLLVAIPLFLLGGWSWVVWGVFVRISLSIVGHWTITYFCHNPGRGTWNVTDACVQASNLPGLGLLTYGECWHNNHHAFPESAKIGLEEKQPDPAWWFILLLKKLGFIQSISLPRPQDQWDDLEPRRKLHK